MIEGLNQTSEASSTGIQSFLLIFYLYRILKQNQCQFSNDFLLTSEYTDVKDFSPIIKLADY